MKRLPLLRSHPCPVWSETSGTTDCSEVRGHHQDLSIRSATTYVKQIRYPHLSARDGGEKGRWSIVRRTSSALSALMAQH